MMQRFTTWMLAHQKRFYILVGVLLLSIIGLPLITGLLDRRQKYKWNEYNDLGVLESKQPFGAKYVDEHLRSKWNDEIIVDSSFSDVLQKHQSKPCNILLLDNSYYFNTGDEDLIANAVAHGCHIIFGPTSHYLCRTFNVDYNGDTSFNIDDFKSNGVKQSAISFSIPNKPEKYFSCAIWDNMLKTSYYVNMDMDYSDDYYKPDLDENAEKYTTTESFFNGSGSIDLVKDTPGNTYVLERKFGLGKITFNGIPLLFSNYGMSVPDLQKMSDQIIDETFDSSLPLIVIYTVQGVSYNSNNVLEGEDSMFYVLLKHKETALALYILLVMLMLWFAFNIRRRRNPQPQIQLEKNTNIDYIRHIATLYTRNSDYKDLLKIEQRKLLYRLRKEYQFDISTRSFTKPSEYSGFISRTKGIDESEVREVLRTLEDMTSYNGDISRTNYLNCLKMLNSLNDK